MEQAGSFLVGSFQRCATSNVLSAIPYEILEPHPFSNSGTRPEGFFPPLSN